MSRDSAPRHKYRVEFRVVMLEEAESEMWAITYAQNKLDEVGAADTQLVDFGREDA
jgi:hypothetical protein